MFALTFITNWGSAALYCTKVTVALLQMHNQEFIVAKMFNACWCDNLEQMINPSISVTYFDGVYQMVSWRCR